MNSNPLRWQAKPISEPLQQAVQSQLSSLPLAALTPAQLAQIEHLVACSSFAGRVLLQQPELMSILLDAEPISQLQLTTDATEAQVMSQLRRYRNASLVQILADDVFARQSVAQSLKRVSLLADELINAAYHWAYAELAKQWGQPLDEQGQPMPLLILGMGKLGGGELNFSSDIDLILVYPQNGDTSGGRRSSENQQFYTRLGQKLIALLHQVTADGFVYRVDMRLRPFGDSGPLVLSFAAFEDYYQAQGRDWERYAMLKARILNPREPFAQELTSMLKPFVYRRYIDFSAIESLRRMKQLIEQENRRRNRIDNIKLGAGGIREVEFIVQTLQLIRGGRIPQLQQPSIFLALQALADNEILTQAQADALLQDYLILRQVEQSLQGMDDQQTQTLPADPLARERLVLACAATDWDDLSQRINQAMARVHQQFKQVIAHEDNAEPEQVLLGRILWDSELSAVELADEINWLAAEDAVQLVEAVVQFKHDCQKRSVGPRGRELLAKLIPQLLHDLELEQAGSAVLSRVLVVFRQIVSRTAYLELLFENPKALQQLVKLCGRSGWLSTHLARYPMLLDELIDPELLYQVATVADYRDRLRLQLLRVPEDDLELVMETLRQYKQAQQLRIAAADITGILPLMKVSDHLTWLAEAVMEKVVDLAWQQMVEKYGYPAGLAAGSPKNFAVVAYGKLGGLELGYGSDLDLVFLHQCDSLADTSGDRAIDSRQFYLKLVQRILHLCTTRTASGVLYDVDTRLRPSGNAGLLTVHIETYRDYLLQDAWTWEHQALVRTRLIYGDAVIARRFDDIRAEVLAKPRDLPKLQTDVVEMRQKLREHHGVDNAEVKHASGGVVDLEFISQYLVLAYAAKFPCLYQYSDNIRILDAAVVAGLMPLAQAALLQQAYRDLRGVSHRLTLEPVDTTDLPDVSAAMQQVQASWALVLETAPVLPH
ncbi:bifunctional [glutamate--ammonia ligase]-adenylyl-L-tyrosine phosphorylase/[glutamate--ammonia-ligase] adenylyltransferase [Rheinheimera riviphila]|uniref:Bifunctional glutamine synthetase adenylyltransferase/adenylyl-removing enzyme n=1 Tax=Rheinheimera riviphila TaxID=1834037 RepID=A0A437QEZ3_9GAMM|nr:bifunctional [glutamate--ammonia ligase]-adenylyl-L-tyrosine phosphorylase/[glutamate--ammonia-ligase] adenylyltransferase [Rheinheimera riviphila]RVU33148.1 bifunctional [glutamate--ammonia ligase]-adenylyl-L-tyrosine phosphorylase/[glutamate--ammonia-ligase] adenylyltransferase [Rheinheimera riviphila]